MQLKTLIFMAILLSGVGYSLDIAACGVLAAGTSYTLTVNLLNQSGTCFTTGGAGVTFDGRGYLVDGTGGIDRAFSDAFGTFIIRNVRITDMDIAVVQSANILSTSNLSGSNISSSVYSLSPAYTSLYINTNTFTNSTAGVYFSGAVNSKGITIANSTFNTTANAFYFRHTNASLINITSNSTFYHVITGGRVEYTNITSPNYGLIYTAPNITNELNYTNPQTSTALIFKTYNHDSGARLNYSNYTITNTTGSFTTYDIYWFVLDKRLYPDAKITISNPAGYWDAYIETAASWENGFDSQVSIIPKTATNLAYINFNVVGPSNSPIPGAICGAFKAQGLNWYLVGSKKTEATGTASIMLQTITQYKIICEASGYPSLTSYITPTEGTYTITLYGNNSVGFPTNLEGVRTSFNTTAPIAWNITQTFNFSIYNTSDNSSLDWFAWRIYNGTTLLNSQNDSTHPSGGSLTYTFMPGNTSRIMVNIIFKRINRGAVDFTFYVPVYQQYDSTGGASLSDALDSARTALGPFTIVIITLTLGAMVSGWVAGFSPGAAVAVFLGFLTLGFYIGSSIITGILLLTAFIIAGAYYMLRGGG